MILFFCLIFVADSIRDRQHIDPDFHINRSMVRDMLSLEVQVYHGTSEKRDYRNLGNSPFIWLVRYKLIPFLAQ